MLETRCRAEKELVEKELIVIFWVTIQLARSGKYITWFDERNFINSVLSIPELEVKCQR